MTEKWQRLREEYGRLEGLLGFPPKELSISVSDLQHLTKEEFERLKAKAESAKRQAEWNELEWFSVRIRGEVGEGAGRSSFPVMNLWQHAQAARDSNMYKLKRFIGSKKIEIERFNETIEVLRAAVLSEEVKKAARERSRPIRIRYDTGAKSKTENIHWSEYAELAELTKEKIDLLNACIKFRARVIKIYRKEIRDRQEQKDHISEIIDEARQMCQKAAKCREKLLRLNNKVVKSGKISSKSAEVFVDTKKLFDSLLMRLPSLKDQVEFLTDEALDFPKPPPDFIVGELSEKQRVEGVHKQHSR